MNSDSESLIYNFSRWGGIAVPLIAEVPDILYGYNWNANRFFTDQIKETAYHEFSHASHYRKTSFQLWVDNINFIAHYGAYGSAGDPGVERTDLIEMWGYFMGREYAHRRYGPTRHSLAATAAFNNGWYRWNENGAGFGLFESNGHIAAGFLHDIIDDNIYNTANGLTENNAVILDSIQGFTISSVFNQMGSSTTSATALINNLKAFIPGGIGNNTTNYDSLKSYYGY